MPGKVSAAIMSFGILHSSVNHCRIFQSNKETCTSRTWMLVMGCMFISVFEDVDVFLLIG